MHRLFGEKKKIVAKSPTRQPAGNAQNIAINCVVFETKKIVCDLFCNILKNPTYNIVDPLY
ncbi:MAG: hypothetical protein APF83_14045 [Lutibacter sp. BRH_c52]|nr:MAG: hypothetical protein APF83_14045 [Lutibacter sp. BRH_c52]